MGVRSSLSWSCSTSYHVHNVIVGCITLVHHSFLSCLTQSSFWSCLIPNTYAHMPSTTEMTNKMSHNMVTFPSLMYRYNKFQSTTYTYIHTYIHETYVVGRYCMSNKRIVDFSKIYKQHDKGFTIYTFDYKTSWMYSFIFWPLFIGRWHGCALLPKTVGVNPIEIFII